MFCILLLVATLLFGLPGLLIVSGGGLLLLASAMHFATTSPDERKEHGRT